MAIKYAIDQHAVAFPTKLVAQNGGEHIYNIQLTTDTDNGNLIAKGEFVELDLYKEGAVTSFKGKVLDKAANGNWYVEVTEPGDALFVYQQPFIAEEWTHKFQKESNFYNLKDDVVRAYALHVGDIFEVSEAGFAETPEKGKEIDSVEEKKLKAAAPVI